MTPLLDLYLYLNNDIPFLRYKAALDDFDKLWGTNLHILTDNLSKNIHLQNLLDYLRNSQFMSFSFLDGTETGVFNDLSKETLINLEKAKVNALAIPINKNLTKDKKYADFFISNRILKLETYLKITKDNHSDLDDLINFMQAYQIKLCIVDIEKAPSANKKLTMKEYEACISKLRGFNKEGKLRFSIIECPYPLSSSSNSPQIFGGCCGGISSCMINYNGDILPCHYLKIFPQGNIMKDNLRDIWNNSELFAKLRDRKNNIKGMCQNCEFLISCGGCRAESFYKYNSLFFDDPYCLIKKTEIT